MSEEIIDKDKSKELVDELKTAGQSIVDAQLVDEYEDESQIDYNAIIKRFKFIKSWSIVTLVLFFLVFIPILAAWFVLEVNVDDPSVTLQQKQHFGGITIGLIIISVIMVGFEVVQFFNKLWAIKIKKVHPKLNQFIQFKYGILIFIIVGSVSLLIYSNKAILILKNYLKKQAKLAEQNQNNQQQENQTRNQQNNENQQQLNTNNNDSSNQNESSNNPNNSQQKQDDSNTDVENIPN